MRRYKYNCQGYTIKKELCLGTGKEERWLTVDIEYEVSEAGATQLMELTGVWLGQENLIDHLSEAQIKELEGQG